MLIVFSAHGVPNIWSSNMSQNQANGQSLAAHYQSDLNQVLETSGALKEIPADLLGDVAGALMENPR
jgi:hypothetical protein